MTAACEICPVVLFFSGGPQISGGGMNRQPCQLGRVALVFAPPESTSPAEKTQRRRRNRTSDRVSSPSSVICSAEVATRGGETQTRARQPDQVPFRDSRPWYVAGGSIHPGATHTSAGEIIERRCCLGSVAFVISPPASTSRAGERNVGGEIGRSATSIAPPSRWLQVPVAEQAGRNRRPHIKSEKSPLLQGRHWYFPG